MKTRKTPQRMCIACRQSRPKSELLRAVRTPDGQVLVDRTGKMNGRGAYLCPDKACLQKAIRSNALFRTLQVQVDDDMIKQLEESYESGQS